MTWGPAPIHRLPIVDGDLARITLTRGLTAICDAEDVPLLGTYRWHAQRSSSGSFYASRNAPNRRTTTMHRLILGVNESVLVDHANHDTLDNRRSNLRVATVRDNNRNVASTRIDNRSGYIGVGYHAQCDRWRARVSVDGRRHSIGLFATAQEAALARDAYVRTHFPSEFWTFNFPLRGERGIDTKVRTA